MTKRVLIPVVLATSFIAAPLMAQDGVSMTDPISTNWADNGSQGAMADPPMDATGSYGDGSYGSSGGMGIGSGSSSGGGSSGQVLINTRDDASINQRRGRGQNTLELNQTTLLNSFSGAGFMGVRNFRKDGDRYIAEAQERSGAWTTVELNPQTGAIQSVR